jgi:hypothetical protein
MPQGENLAQVAAHESMDKNGVKVRTKGQAVLDVDDRRHPVLLAFVQDLAKPIADGAITTKDFAPQVEVGKKKIFRP